MVDLIDSSSTPHTIWSGTDPTSGSEPVDFELDFPATYTNDSYNVGQVEVFVSNTNGDAGIDAVELLTGGSATSTVVSTQGFDSTGNYDSATYNSSNQPLTVDTYTGAILTQTVASTYTSGYLSATVTTDAAGDETQDTFDSHGNKLTETDGYGSGSASTTTFTYDTSNRMTSLTDAQGDETTWAYTADTTTMTDPLGNTDVKTYNSQNQLVSELNPNNLLTTYVYDDNGNLTTETEYAGSTDTSTVVDTLTWSYNADGTVASAGNDNGTYTFTYDDQGRVIGVTEPFGVSLSFGYDQYGNRNLVEDNLGGVETSVYNANAQLLSRVLTESGVTLRIDFTYDQFGRVLSESRYSNAVGTALVARTTYTYDSAGNATSMVSENIYDTTLDEFYWV